MRVSQLFTKTSKTAPADEVAKNAQLLIRAGFVYKVMAGVYAYTPLGLRVLENIKEVVREEMNAIGGQELIMSSLQKRETWEETGRWDDEVVDVWFKSKLKDDTEVGFGWSHEEAIIEMVKQYLESYKDLPINVYQFQTKMRNELRAKSGIMRGREFIMKDMYSCSIDSVQHDAFYESAIEAYNRVFERLGIGTDTYVTFASGGAFTQFSHEFQTICDAGEDVIYLHREKNIAVNEEVLDDKNLAKLGIKREELEKVKSAEVGNIFNFGTQKSEDTNFTFTNAEGKKQPVYMGSYGIGITRLMGVIVEKFSDEKGIVWPENIAPAKVYLVRIGGEEAVKQADALYDELMSLGIEVLYDDRDERPGAKFADAELMGIPYRLTVSDRLIEAGRIEYTPRMSGVTEQLTRDELLGKLN
ncbi:His/Gly/Thr/Pro-type tRNA ligase C-terminal domain-containing protein [Streptomyces caniscabiei]|uniref:aminoacyl--tRNA ligase-related protein n=1 Tax=Streptomyces caniscabiei TaxID=2746961 RepID=UPI0029B8E5A2|nr:aminoacyl--tRNA ligase-related protein [Streptomyces caniscabiei]MDX2776218.1 His/Gly/Thr/Pro-type tRNA ligase C-terminal domain-containing protein [Streptomyces caniscabiei]